MPADLETDADDQDMAEIFDEDNITEDGGDIATSDMQRDVFDVTTAVGDSNDDDAEDDDAFDPDTADDDDIDRMLEKDDGLDSPNNDTRDAGDLVMDSEDTPADYEGDDGGIETDDNDDAPDSPPSPVSRKNSITAWKRRSQPAIRFRSVRAPIDA